MVLIVYSLSESGLIIVLIDCFRTSDLDIRFILQYCSKLFSSVLVNLQDTTCFLGLSESGRPIFADIQHLLSVYQKVQYKYNIWYTESQELFLNNSIFFTGKSDLCANTFLITMKRAGE